jgi:hypothetical protein
MFLGLLIVLILHGVLLSAPKCLQQFTQLVNPESVLCITHETQHL